MFSTSPQQVANLSRLAVETYVDSNYSVVANTIFNTKKNPKKLLKALTKPDFKLPKKTREVFLYMPYKMMGIFPTVAIFGNLDLMTGKKERNLMFSGVRVLKQSGSKLRFSNGMTYDMSSGIISMGKQSAKVHRFDAVQYQGFDKQAYKSELKYIDGSYSLIYMKTYDTFAVMDRETYNSAYVQMFILGKYDKELFELVVSSPYSKIYRVKR
jgi:dolichyl-diphosphooligosaccharide--protein glycosyltransferase/undecaprenyl-diphosphooligosaccharide--protein glycosyltransferase